jgi:5-carboxymethyl-2-hydroxymuconate isomerase
MKEFKLKIENQTLDCGTMYCIGRNYSKHAKEMGSSVPEQPIVFLKPATALVQSGQSISLPSISNNVHHEVELCLVISKDCYNVSKEEALDYLLGVAVGIDFTLRDVQNHAKDNGLPWTTAKAFYGSAPISEVIPMAKLNESPNNMGLEITVNGEVRQIGNTKDMERSCEELISYLSTLFYLRKGDVIFTGTPEGVSQVVSGDKIQAKLSNYAELNIEID